MAEPGPPERAVPPPPKAPPPPEPPPPAPQKAPAPARRPGPGRPSPGITGNPAVFDHRKKRLKRMYPRVYPEDPILGFFGGFKPELRWA
jgi:hypothetical protein